MESKWIKWCKEADMSCQESTVQVTLSNKRYHKVDILEENDGIILEGKIHGSYKPENFHEFLLSLWERNRAIDICGFAFKENGAVVGRASLPMAGLTKTLLQSYVRKVAVECDRLEYLLTGRDSY